MLDGAFTKINVKIGIKPVQINRRADQNTGNIVNKYSLKSNSAYSYRQQRS